MEKSNILIEASQPIPEHRRTFKSVNLLCLLKLISFINNVLIKLMGKNLRKPTNFVSKYQIFCSILSKVIHNQKRCVHSWTPCIMHKKLGQKLTEPAEDYIHVHLHMHQLQNKLQWFCNTRGRKGEEVDYGDDGGYEGGGKLMVTHSDLHSALA